MQLGSYIAVIVAVVYRLAAAAPIRPLAWKLPYAARGPKKQKKKRKKKITTTTTTNRKHTHTKHTFW